MTESSQRSAGTTVIAVVNGLAALLHVAFWLAVFSKLASPSVSEPLSPASISTIYGFGVADLVWSAPLLAASAVGLWRSRFWGWLFAQWCNVLYWYSLSVILVRDVSSGSLSPGAVLFSPFALFSFWAAGHLWVHRHSFHD